MTAQTNSFSWASISWSTSSMCPETLNTSQPSPQLGVMSSSPGSEKFTAVTVLAAPMSPSLASLLVSEVASQTHVRPSQMSCRDQARRPPLWKHLAPTTVHFTPSRPSSGVAAEGPQGSSSSSSGSPSTDRKPRWSSVWRRARELLAECESPHSSSLLSICSRVQEVAALSPPVQSTSISLRMSSPTATGSWPKPRFISSKDTSPSPSSSTCAKRNRIFARSSRMFLCRASWCADTSVA
mmetsp:Transcript_163790/g.398077  ORF Transcript_163790/g.398077 Transcript_163790/m.398077 type:complete len:239 (-) Transcript_163790:128-844(-)